MKLKKIRATALMVTLSLLCTTACVQSSLGSDSASEAISKLTQTRLERYAYLLEATYLQDVSVICDFNTADQKVAEAAVGYLRDTFPESGMTIDKASVNITAERIRETDDTLMIDVTLSTVITHHAAKVPNAQTEQSSWIDPHQITLDANPSPSSHEDMPSTYIGVINDQTTTVYHHAAANTMQSVEDITPYASKDIQERQRKTSPQRVAGAYPAYQFRSASEYAIKWTSAPYAGDEKEHFNPDYPYNDAAAGNCTNFVSQVLHEGGKVPYAGFLVTRTEDSTWAFFGLAGIGVASYTWSGAANNYRYMRDHSGLFQTWTDSIYTLGEGSLLYVDWDGGGTIDHALYVSQTERTGFADDGTMIYAPYITQKSNNRCNILMSTYVAMAKKDNPNLKWYGLQMKWRTTP